MHMRAGLALLLAPIPALAAPQAAFVVIGENGQATARAITGADRCPDIIIDGRSLPMAVRAPSETVPQRPTASTPENSKPSEFPVLTCDAVLPVGARTASISGQHLPAFGRNIRRIVVIGDTGCRLKAADDAYQACNDPAAYPFARIAARAAKWKPQLVIHVGDYHYRENPCPQGNRGCEGSPWGYGWDAWNADFFAPGAPLLAAAPWVVVRGNHENCPRAGQGWWRFIDPRPISPNRDCNRPEDDGKGDAATVYAVPIGGGARVIVADLATSPDTRGVATAIRDRAASHQRAFRYLLTDKAGQQVAGDLPRSADRIGWATISIAEPETGGDPPDEPAPMETFGVALSGGGSVVVGSDIYEVQELREWLDTVALWSGIGITFLALIAGYVIAAIFTRRLERLNTSINTIMGGRLDERVPVIGMDGEFDRLSANLNRMLDRIEALMTGVRQVSTDIAHDLRTPITRLRQHLESAVTDEDVPVPQHVIEEALTQVDGIMKIFGALLRIGTIEAGAGRARFQRVDLSEIMERVLLAYQPVAEDSSKMITGAIHPGILVDGDADLLAQMFTNLIENALRHTPTDSAITLALRAEGDTIVAEVSDNGPGIPAEERENVVKRFYQLDTSRTDIGAGLGLALVAAIADLHGTNLALCDAGPGLRVELRWSTTDQR